MGDWIRTDFPVTAEPVKKMFLPCKTFSNTDTWSYSFTKKVTFVTSESFVTEVEEAVGTAEAFFLELDQPVSFSMFVCFTQKFRGSIY